MKLKTSDIQIKDRIRKEHVSISKTTKVTGKGQ